MHIDDVVRTLKRKLQEVGVPEIPIHLEMDEPGPFLGIDNPIHLAPTEKGVVLSIRNITSYSDNALERILEHRAAGLAERKQTGPTPVFGSTHPAIGQLHANLAYAYREYAAGKRMIEEFGQPKYDEYHDTCAPGLCDAIHNQWHLHRNPGERFKIISLFLREHAKDLLSTSDGLSPKIIGQLVPAMGEVFTYIRSIGTPTLEQMKDRVDAGILRAKLVSLLGAHLVEHVDVLNSYEDGLRAMNEEAECDILDRFEPPLSENDLLHAAHVQTLILRGYGLVPPSAPRIRTFYVGHIVPPKQNN